MVDPTPTTPSGPVSTSGYDAVKATKRRRVPRVNLKHEDKVLLPFDRDRLISEARNLRRNSSIVAWALRTHLNNCAEFTFQCRSGDTGVDREVESLWSWWDRPFNSDITGRHAFSRLTRIIEGLAFTEGDCLVYKIVDTTEVPGKSLGYIQVIEADRVRTPSDTVAYDQANETKTDVTQFTHGVRISPTGKPLQYAICDRTAAGNGYILKEIVDAQHVLHHGYFDRVDQNRGISQLASAINTFKDLYESADYALGKMKVAQLFAMKLKRGEGIEPSEDDFKFDLNAAGILELTGGDDADFLESRTPSQEFQNYFVAMTQAGLKAADLPYSWFDESHTNYSGARLACIHAEFAAEDKRNNLRQRVLLPLAIWRLKLWIADGTLKLPDGMGIEDLNIQFIAGALPTIDPQKESAAKQNMLAMGLASRQMLAKQDGNDFFAIAQQLKDEENYLASINLKLDDITPPTAALAEGTPDNDDSDTAVDKAAPSKSP